eukprot:5169699-Pyramimonas_sp.AAC.1
MAGTRTGRTCRIASEEWLMSELADWASDSSSSSSSMSESSSSSLCGPFGAALARRRKGQIWVHEFVSEARGTSSTH